ncbi:MAG: hypothetical protein HY769_09820 [Candidatus Stahlbacteria bacterium]|nr:hypothetical protein [Candidatus Stahlbacteria bacterium]
MAKFRTSGIIQSIRGKVGDMIFSSWKGIPTARTINKRRKRPSTQEEVRVKEHLIILIQRWKKLTLEEKGLWEVYARTLNDRKYTPTTGGIIRNRRKGVMIGVNAFIKINGLKMSVGFPISDKPYLRQSTPVSPPKTNLMNYEKFKNGKIKFETWLPHAYYCKCKAQIWIKAMNGNGYPYMAKVVDIDTNPTEVEIEKIKFTKRKKEKEKYFKREKEFKEMEKCEIMIQMRTIAENGKSSMSSALYRVEVYPNS